MSDAQTTNDQIVVSSPEQQDRKLNTRVSALLLRTRETRVCKHAHDRSSVINLVGQLSWVDTHATFYTVFARRNRT